MKTDRLPQDTQSDVVPDAGPPRSDERGAQLGGWPLTQPFPFLLTPADLRQVFQIRLSYYFKLQKLGRFRQFEAPSVLGAGRGERHAVRYSGAKVKAFLDGQPSRTFGGARGPRVKVVPIHDGTVAGESSRRNGKSVTDNSVAGEIR